ncbi:MAG: hypothetical protein P8012_07425 [Desulfobacterales bacterium]
MTDNTVITDQRRYKRYKTREDTLVSFTSGSLQMGRIINIGRGGLAFYCVDTKKQIISSFKMNIFLANDGYNLTEIPFKIVSEFSLSGKIYGRKPKLRRCCVEYGQLTHSQSSSLDYFIKNYTIDNF